MLKLRTLDRGGVDSSNPFEDDITFMDEEDGDGSAQFMDKGGRNPFLQPEGRESTSPFSEKVSFFCVLIICWYFYKSKNVSNSMSTFDLLLILHTVCPGSSDPT